MGDHVKEKELRLALVCYGGISLAVYMHGFTKEILKLVRASRDYQNYTNCEDARITYDAIAQPRKDSVDSERVYFDLIKLIGRHIDLRVVVDVIAGASAGGINGVILARALAHDLNIDPVRDFWLNNSDVSELMPLNVKAGPWQKWYLRPFIWILLWHRRKDFGNNIELKKKLSMFLRSRWFKPPFDGHTLTRVLYDAFSAMGNPIDTGSSLVPAGQQLDLLVTVTDFHGYITETPIHDPPVIRDREHRRALHFYYNQWPRGQVKSDFDFENLPALVFAARATSSFPGAFPPARITEIDQFLNSKGVGWPKCVDFIHNNFQPYLHANLDPRGAAFIDGSVLNNKPFSYAIDAIRGRAAYRHVDRRLLYIDPHPKGYESRSWGRIPGWFETLKGALSDIPRNEPIHDDLAWVNTYNTEVRRMQAVVGSARAHIRTIANAVVGNAFDHKLDGQLVGRLREKANNRARIETGFAYEGYLRLKLSSVIEEVATLFGSLCGYQCGSTELSHIIAVTQNWARLTGVIPDNLDPSTSFSLGSTAPPWVRFLLRFDVRYRQRRIRFVIRAVNQLYTRISNPEFEGLGTERLDRIKAGLYDALALLRPLTVEALTSGYGESIDSIKKVAAEIIQAIRVDPVLSANPTAVAEKFSDAITEALTLLGNDLGLERDNERTDALLVVLVDGMGAAKILPTPVRRELIEHYIGFAVWDVLTFSITNWSDLDEFDEIRVDRLSPDDAQTLRKGDATATLKGIQFHHFGAFFSRAYRENDYLWGRLHAVDRLMDIVLDAAHIEGLGDDINIINLKAQAFRAILDNEQHNLPGCRDLIHILQKEVAELSST